MALIKSIRGFTPKFGKDCFIADRHSHDAICNQKSQLILSTLPIIKITKQTKTEDWDTPVAR